MWLVVDCYCFAVDAGWKLEALMKSDGKFNVIGNSPDLVYCWGPRPLGLQPYRIGGLASPVKQCLRRTPRGLKLKPIQTPGPHQKALAP